MQSASRRPTARQMAAEMSANLPGDGGGTSDSMVEITGFAPTARNIEVGDNVQFITGLQNNTSESQWVQVFVMIDGVANAVNQYTLDSGESRDVASTRSYADLTETRDPGDYELSVQVQVGEWGAEQHSQSWGTITLVDPNADDGGDNGGDNGGGDNNDGGTTTPELPVPAHYLYVAGAGFFGLLFLLALL